MGYLLVEERNIYACRDSGAGRRAGEQGFRVPCPDIQHGRLLVVRRSEGGAVPARYQKVSSSLQSAVQWPNTSQVSQ